MHDLLIPPLDIPLADADRVILGKVCDAATGELGSSPECYTTKRFSNICCVCANKASTRKVES